MKKITIIFAVTVMTNLAVAQGLQKGNLFGVHLITVTLQPNVKMDEFQTFFVDELLPVYEKSWVGLKGKQYQSGQAKKHEFFHTYMVLM